MIFTLQSRGRVPSKVRAACNIADLTDSEAGQAINLAAHRWAAQAPPCLCRDTATAALPLHTPTSATRLLPPGDCRPGECFSGRSCG